MPRVYLISKFGDVLLGLATGVMAYGLYERRQFRAEEDKLASLVQWKWAQRAQDKAVQAVEDEGMRELERELAVKQEQAAR
ncbi:hypothetical protein JCM10207_004900 [Rhodosporidiobolus poonsookiae]